MHPVFVEIFGFSLPTYGVLMAVAFLLALGWSVSRARRMGMNPDLIWEAAPWIIFSAVVGARLFYFIYFPDFFWTDPLGAIFSRGGLVWYGGVFGAIAAILVYTRLRKVAFLAFTDVIVPAAVLGLAIGRIGCFLAGCCYGGPCDLPWAVVYPAGHETHPHAVHPVQLYESAGAVLLSVFLAWISGRRVPVGITSWAFVAGYGVLRFFLEYARGDRLIWLTSLDLSASQTISLLAVALGGTLILVLSRKDQTHPLDALKAI